MSSMDVADTVSAEAMAVEGEAVTTPEPLITSIRIEGDEGVGMPSDHTSSDYYFDSYAHFGEWCEVLLLISASEVCDDLPNSFIQTEKHTQTHTDSLRFLPFLVFFFEFLNFSFRR